MDWWALFFPLMGVVVGAAIATLSQWSLARYQVSQSDRNELRHAAADLIGTYGSAWSALIGARKASNDLPTDEALGYIDRNAKYSYFAMCPGAEAHLDAVDANRRALKQLVAAFSADDETWKQADREMLRCQQLAQASIRGA